MATSVSQPGLDDSLNLTGIQIGNLTPGAREKLIAQCLLFLAQNEAVANTAIATIKAKVDSASDMVQSIAYLDASDSTNRRINYVQTSSASLGLAYRDTMSYGGSAGDYYLTGVTRTA